MDSNRIFRPLLWLLVIAGGFFGLASFIAPVTFADLTGFAGTDLFTYRLAGAATFAYAVGLAAGTLWYGFAIAVVLMIAVMRFG